MKQYRNAARTKNWIRKAFLELVAEKKSIDKITVNELANRADITKTTFYYHYDDIYAVAEEFENELISELSATLDKISEDNPNDYSYYIRQGLSFIKENEENYKLAVRSSDLTYFSAKLKSIFSKQMTDISVKGFSKEPSKRAIQGYFIVSACVETIVEYLKGNLSQSIDEVGEVLIEAIDKLKN